MHVVCQGPHSMLINLYKRDQTLGFWIIEIRLEVYVTLTGISATRSCTRFYQPRFYGCWFVLLLRERTTLKPVLDLNPTDYGRITVGLRPRRYASVPTPAKFSAPRLVPLNFRATHAPVVSYYAFFKR